MKKILIVPMILLFTSLSAQEVVNSVQLLKVADKVAFTNLNLAKNNDKIKTTLDIYSIGYQYREPKIEYQIFPNPVNMGEYVTISPVKLGEVINIYEPTGAFVQSQVIDIDKRIETLDLKKGEYIVSTETAILNLLVE